jgi:hypothetical protein
MEASDATIPSTDQRSLGLLCAVLVQGFRKYVNPYLKETEREPLRKIVRPLIDPTMSLQDFWRHFPTLCLAACLGLDRELLNLVTRWPDDYFGPMVAFLGLNAPITVLYGLGDAQQVNHHCRRLKLRLETESHVRGWLAHTEWTALDFVRDHILGASSKQYAEEIVEILCLVQAPEAAPILLDLIVNGGAPPAARRWFDEQVGNATAGLLPLAAGRGKLSEAALNYLREYKARGFTAVLEEQLKTAAAEVADKVRREILERSEQVFEPLDEQTTPEWLHAAVVEVQEGRPPTWPDWLRLERLPPLLLGERRLTPIQVQAVLQVLRKSTLADPWPLVGLLRQHLDPLRLDAFAWRLFEMWLGLGSPSKDKWALLSIGLLGGDASVLKLAPLIRAWPGQSQHQRAVTGLECLRAIGSDTALMQLNSIAEKLRFKALQNRAKGFMIAIAADRGLTTLQLEDRIVPDLDLDERGTRIFDFGPRQFQVVLGPDLKPLVRDAAGKLKGELPKGGSKDDATKAAAAIAAWKLLKKQMREVVRFQASRLEQGMVNGRRWSVSEFESFLVRHPLLINLVRRLVWGCYDPQRKLVSSFRVTEERDYAGSDEASFALDANARIGVAHPLHLSEEQRTAWGEVFSDYEIIPPFPQLGRRVHLLQPEEENATEITRFNGPNIPSMIFLGILKGHGWETAPLEMGRPSGDQRKYFPGADTTAVIDQEMGSSEDQVRINEVFFHAGGLGPGANQVGAPLRLADVDPVVVSEVLGSLAVVASKGVS